MANIFPNETVILYSGVRLDPEYHNTLRWHSLAAQNAYFHETLAPVSTRLTNLSYQRVNSGVIRVQFTPGVLNQVNYMCFKNTDLNNKWFYAFVTKVEYVNNVTCDIYYELDYIQSYYFDCLFLDSYIERAHVSNDAIGANTVPEPFEISEAWPALIREINLGDSGYAIVCAKVDLQDSADFAGAAISGNLCSTVKYYIFNADRNSRQVGSVTYQGFTTLTGLLKSSAWANAANEIVSFFEFPFNLIATPTNTLDNCETRDVLSTDYNITIPNNLHGYIPRNNKLFTFPYNYLTVDNGDTINQYRWEWFRNNAVQFRYTGALCCNPEVYLMPIAYANSDGDSQPCWSQKSVISDFPQIPYAIDSYKAWLAQTQSSRKGKLVSGAAAGAGTGALAGAKVGAAAGAAGAAAGGIIGGVLGAITGGIGASGSNAMSEAEARDASNKYTGQSTGSTELAVGKQAFRVNQMAITYNQARIIDEFFTMYGYQINRVGTPSRFTRERWNYIKTNGANFYGSAPAEAVRVFKRVHDRGITYWQTHDEIGNYSLSNNPT